MNNLLSAKEKIAKQFITIRSYLQDEPFQLCLINTILYENNSAEIFVHSEWKLIVIPYNLNKEQSDVKDNFLKLVPENLRKIFCELKLEYQNIILCFWKKLVYGLTEIFIFTKECSEYYEKLIETFIE